MGSYMYMAKSHMGSYMYKANSHMGSYKYKANSHMGRSSLHSYHFNFHVHITQIKPLPL